jgi:VWFA-related protein
MMSRSNSHRLPLWLLAALLLAAGLVPVPLAAEEEEDEPVFFDTIDVRRVNVEVYVTDRQGRPVSGLTAEDFEVFEDGRRVQVTNFFAVEDGRGGQQEREEERAVAQEDGAPPLPPTHPLARRAPLPEDQRLLLVVFIDNANIRPEHRAQVFINLRQFLSGQLSLGDRVMVVTYERSLNVRQPFTSDSQRAADSLYEIERLVTEGPQIDRERRQALDRAMQARSAFEAMDSIRFFAETRRHETEMMLREMGQLLTSMAGLEGRKAILYVSDGVPMVPGEELFWAVNERFADVGALTESRMYDMSRRFREMVAQANAGRITFYTLDASGGRPFSRVSAEVAVPVSPTVDTMQTINLQRPLEVLADDSGGIAVLNTRNFGGAFDRIAQDFRNYYSLAYSPPTAWDGRYRTIEVRVPNRQWPVRHRKGYRARAPAVQVADQTLAAVLYDQGSNPMKAELELGALQRREGRNFLLPLVVRVPISEVVLIPRGQEMEGRLTLYFALADHRGDRSPVQEVEFPVRVRQADAERAQGLTYAYEGALMVGTGQQRLAVGIRDQIGGTTSFLVVPVSAPDA